MLNFEILNSPDEQIIGPQTNYFDSFILGSSQRADIVISDESIEPLHITLEVKDSNIICRSFEKGHSFLVNGKKYSGTKVIKAQDVLKIGETEIKILNFLKMEAPDNRNIEELYSSALERVPQLEDIIFQLEREILVLEKDIEQMRSSEKAE